MSKSFGYILFGFVLVLIDLRIGFIDSLPDFIGFIIIASASHKIYLESRIPAFKNVCRFSELLVVSSFIIYIME